MNRLYTLSTVANNVFGCDRVRIEYGCHERPEPITPYQMVVENYSDIKESDRQNVQDASDELLNKEEFYEVSGFLKARGVKYVIGKEFQLPIPLGRIISYRDRVEKGDRVDILKGTLEHRLSVPIFAWYRLTGCPETTKTPDEHVQLGLGLTKELFFSKVFAEQRIARALKAIYAETGLYVGRDYKQLLAADKERICSTEYDIYDRTSAENRRLFIKLMLGKLRIVRNGDGEGALHRAFRSTGLYIREGRTEAERARLRRLYAGRDKLV